MSLSEAEELELLELEALAAGEAAPVEQETQDSPLMQAAGNAASFVTDAITDPVSDVGVGAAETAMSMGSGVLGQIVAGLRGAQQFINTGSPEQANQIIEQTVGALTYNPRTPEGQAGVQAVGSIMQNDPYAQAEQAAGEWLGEKGYQMAGPAGGAVGETLPMAAAMLTPFAANKAMQSGPLRPLPWNPAKPKPRPRAPDAGPPRGKSPLEIKEALESGQPTSNTVGYQLADDAPKGFDRTPLLDRGKETGVVTNPAARNAAKASVGAEDILRIEQADKPTRRGFMKMLNIQDNRRANPTLKTRPAHVAGEAILNRVKVLEKAREIAGNMVSREVGKLRGRVDLSPVLRNFQQKLSDMGVRFADDGSLDFSTSELSLTPADQNALTEAYQLVLRSRTPSAKAAHHLKRAVTKRAQFGKTQEGVDASVVNAVKGIRADVNDVLRQHSPSYGNANSHYEATVKVLNDIHKRLGDDVDFDSLGAQQTASVINRRTYSEAVSGGAILDELQALDDVVRRYYKGVEGFPSKRLRAQSGVSADQLADNVYDLGSFANRLGKLYGSPAETSFAGLSETAGVRAAEAGAAASAAMTGSPHGAVELYRQAHRFSRKTPSAIEAEQLAAMRKLLEDSM